MSERFQGVYEALVSGSQMPQDEFREFIHHIKSEIVSKCTRFGNFDWRDDHTLVDDLAQQVCMEICSSLQRFDRNLGTFKNWVDAITLNAVRGYIRAKVRKPSPESLDSLVENSDVSDPALMSVSPELLVLMKDKRKILGRLMARLQKRHPNYYLVLYYRSYLDMTVEEIAAKLNCDNDSVYRLTNRALQKLKQWVRKPDL